MPSSAPETRRSFRRAPAAALFAASLVGVAATELSAGRAPWRAFEDDEGPPTIDAWLDGRATRRLDDAAKPKALDDALGPPYREALYVATGRVAKEVVVGPDGWLFLAGCVVGYPSVEARLGVEPCARAAAALADYLASRGCRLVTTPPPNKETMVRDKFPPHVAPPGELLTSILGAWRRRGLAVADLRRALDPAVRDAWMRNDTHWSWIGARAAAELAAEEVLAACGGAVPGVPVATGVLDFPAHLHRGDLQGMLGLVPGSFVDATFNAFPAPQGGVTHDLKPLSVGEPRPIVVVGTSFSSYFAYPSLLGARLGREVEDASVAAIGPVRPMIDRLEAAEEGRRPWPELIVWEFPERSVQFGSPHFTARLVAWLARRGFTPDYAAGPGAPGVASVEVLRATSRPAGPPPEPQSPPGPAYAGAAEAGEPALVLALDGEIRCDGAFALACEVATSRAGLAQTYVDADGAGDWRASGAVGVRVGATRIVVPLRAVDVRATRRVRLDLPAGPSTYRVGRPEIRSRRP